MKKIWEEYKNAIVANTIYDIIKQVLITLLSLIVAGTLGSIIADLTNNKYLIKYKVAIIIIFVLVTALGIMKIYAMRSKNRPALPAIETDYTVVSRKTLFVYGKDCSTYKLYIKGKSNRKGLNRYYGKYTWSGSDNATIKCNNNHYNLHYLTRKDSFIEYEIEFPKAFKKGKMFELDIEGTMPDSEHKFVPYFTSLVSVPTDYLEMNICIPPEYNVKEIICEEIAAMRTSNDDSEIVQLNEHGEYCWKINNPKLLYKYTIRWEL